MSRAQLMVFALPFAAVLMGGARPQRPEWITEASLTQLRSLGIEPDRDLTTQGNYHWRWVSRRALLVGHFHCPVGSSVDISRTIIVVAASEAATCRDAAGTKASLLKLYADGSAEPF